MRENEEYYVISEKLTHEVEEYLKETGIKCIYERIPRVIRSHLLSDEIKKAKNDLLDKIDGCLLECEYLDDRINGEGGCLGTRNGEHNCDKCQYFAIDISCLRSTIDSMREDIK